MSRTDDEKTRRNIAAARARALDSLETMTDEEDTALTMAALADPDAPPVPTGARFISTQEARRRPGRPRVPSPKQQVTLRLDSDVIAGMRALGQGWQVKVNQALRGWLATVD